MLDSLVSLLKSGTFWAALAVVIAGLPLALLGVRTLRRWSLQRYLNRERASHYSFDSDLTGGYLASVDRGLRGLRHLPQTEKDKAREKLKELIDALKRTHDTIVDALALFSIGKAETFFEKFDEHRVKFEKLMDKGAVAYGARTHCTEIVRIVSDLSSLIGEHSPAWKDINALRDSLEHRLKNPDTEVIVPIMDAILKQTKWVLELIADAISKGHRRKALQIKEWY